MDKIRVRFAPSPTGLVHIGGVRTALFNFLFAKKNKGVFVLRIEDTDRTRFVEGATENIAQSLQEFRLNPDEGVYWDDAIKEKGEFGPYKQSERLDIYRKYADELIKKGLAYHCFCTSERLAQVKADQEAKKLPPRYDKHCLSLSPDEVAAKLSNNDPYTIRIRVSPGQPIEFNDLVHGKVTIDSSQIDDAVLMKSDGYPVYNFANVVDDHLMEISHVIRGDEFIPSTPLHILLYQAFGWTPPTFAHLPPILSKASGKKLSKREGDVSAKHFIEEGYLPEAMTNFLAFLGWNPKTEQEIFTLEELIEQFSFDKVNRAGAVFDLEKLDWINGLYVRRLEIEDLFARAAPFLSLAGVEFSGYPKEFIYKVLKLEQERLRKLSEIGERVKYFFQEPSYDPTLLVWKKGTAQSAKNSLNNIHTLLESFSQTDFTAKNLEEKIKSWISENNFNTGEVLWPLRVALSGLAASPGPFEIMDAFGVLPNGKDLILQRIKKAASSL